MSYLGNSPTEQAFVATVDYFNGDGSTVAFTLSRQVTSVAQVQAVIENVPQNPSSAFTVLGNVITFTSAPPVGTANIYVYYTSPNTKVIAPSSGTVGTDALAAGAVVPAKMANGGAEFGMRNRIINGAMMIDQRNAGASITPAQDAYMTDRWKWGQSQSSKFTAQQVSTAPAGFVNSLKMTVSTAVTIGSSDYFTVYQPIEGLNVSDLAWGTASAATVTLSFWVYSSLTGTFGGGLRNSAGNRSYPFTYTISAANTWEQKTVTIAGDTSGTWLTTNGVGIYLQFGLGVGSTLSGTAGSWAGANYLSATGATSVVGTSGATFYITGVQLEKGSTATPFDFRSYGAELALCQRYYWTGNATMYHYYGFGGSWPAGIPIAYPVSMRAAPTVTIGTNIMASLTNSPTIIYSYPNLFHYSCNVTGSGTIYRVDPIYSTAEL